MEYSEKLKLLPPYLFVEIDKKKKKLIESGVDVINLGVGDPDLPTPPHIVESARKAVLDETLHHYPFGAGLVEFREAVVYWYKKRFNVNLDRDKEVHALLGSKEGIAHLPLSIINPRDIVLIPEPGYPVYRSGTIFAGGEVYIMPLVEKNNYLPDLSSIPENVCKKAKLMFINYPNNPTSAVCDDKFFSEVIKFARKYDIVVAHDAAYSEIYFGDKPPISFLSIPGAMEVGIEFHSLSKTYCMTGWRVGWVCGNEKIIKGLSIVKDNFDSGVFNVLQKAGITALTDSQDCVTEIRKIFKERRDIFVQGLIKNNWKLNIPEATFYVWASCPDGYTSEQTANKLLESAGIVCTPGVGMGSSGEGYIRFALTVSKEKLEEAVRRISKIKW